jgi:hypothetical protein
MMMVVPIPAAMADPVIIRIGRADMNAHRADMRACPDTARSGAGSRAHRADLDAGADLRVRAAREENHDGKYRSRQCFHFSNPPAVERSVPVCGFNEWRNEEFRGPPKNSLPIWPG